MQLTQDAFYYMCSFLSIKDLLQLSRISKGFNKLIKDKDWTGSHELYGYQVGILKNTYKFKIKTIWDILESTLNNGLNINDVSVFLLHCNHLYSNGPNHLYNKDKCIKNEKCSLTREYIMKYALRKEYDTTSCVLINYPVTVAYWEDYLFHK